MLPGSLLPLFLRRESGNEATYIHVHRVVQVLELDILINLPFLWNTILFNIVNSTSYGAFKSKLKLFFT